MSVVSSVAPMKILDVRNTDDNTKDDMIMFIIYHKNAKKFLNYVLNRKEPFQLLFNSPSYYLFNEFSPAMRASNAATYNVKL